MTFGVPERIGQLNNFGQVQEILKAQLQQSSALGQTVAALFEMKDQLEPEHPLGSFLNRAMMVLSDNLNPYESAALEKLMIADHIENMDRLAGRLVMTSANLDPESAESMMLNDRLASMGEMRQQLVVELGIMV